MVTVDSFSTLKAIYKFSRVYLKADSAYRKEVKCLYIVIQFAHSPDDRNTLPSTHSAVLRHTLHKVHAGG